jgi:hypothetical protein
MTEREALKDKFERGVELVRLGSPVVVAATQLGVTEAALRSACLKAGVYIIRRRPCHDKRIHAVTARRRDLVRAYLRNDPFDEICRRAGVSARGAKRMIQRELGVKIDLGPQTNKRSKRDLTFRQLKARFAAREVLEARAKGKDISLAQAARNYQLNRDALRCAIRAIKREALDESTLVSDTEAT